MSDDIDDDLEAWDQIVTAVRALARTARPSLTLAEAVQEALTAWVGEQAALANGDAPFQSQRRS